MNAIVGDGYQATFVKVANGFLEGFLRYLEAIVDELGGGFVAKVAVAVVLVEVAQQCLGKV